jgi:hypothetical protein
LRGGDADAIIAHVKLGAALTNAYSGLQAATRTIEVSSHNTANVVTDGFVPLEASLQSLDGGGVRVRVTRGSGGPGAAEAVGPTSSRTDLVEEVATTVVGVALYRANLRSLQTAADTEGVLVRLAGRRDDDEADASSDEGQGSRRRR